MMSFSEAVNVMLLTHEKYNQFTSKKIVDAKSQSEVLLALSRDNRGAVDAITEKARQAGAVIAQTPQQDSGVLSGRSIADPRGHILEGSWMAVQAAQAAQPGERAGGGYKKHEGG